ncbi:MAG: hypothetical protein EA382_06950 [Spirochaetaceae bacterium]|nr:MAG: hypothetical protein EA382_06950 [Spirochaetaceae bacterium]
MRKKVLLIAFVLVALVAMSASANTFGIGGAFSIDALGGLPSNAMLSVKFPQTPVLWGIGAQLNQDTFNLAMTADWWLYTQNLVGFVNLYVGPGLYLSLPDRIEFGGRVPIGLNAYPIPVLELFLEIAPTLLFFSNQGIQIPSFGLQGAFGFRFWFNV